MAALIPALIKLLISRRRGGRGGGGGGGKPQTDGWGYGEKGAAIATTKLGQEMTKFNAGTDTAVTALTGAIQDSRDALAKKKK